MSNQPEALRLADDLEVDKWHISGVTAQSAADELRRLHAEVSRLQAWHQTAWQRGHAVGLSGLNEAEREACAKLCEDCINLQPYPTMAEIAAAIRARSNA